MPTTLTSLRTRLTKTTIPEGSKKVCLSNKEKKRLEAMGIKPTSRALSEALEVPEEEIINVVKRLEPRINVRQVRVFNDPEDENNLRVEFDYTIVGETLIQTVDFLLETI